MRRKILSALLVVMLFAQCIPLVFANDIYGHREEKIMSILESLDILKGFEDGNFYPDNLITREEYITLILRLLGLEDVALGSPETSLFSDVDPKHWASSYINTAVEMGIVEGRGNGLFGLGDKVTQDEAVKMLVCALGYRDFGENLGGYPSGYTNAGRRLNLFKNYVFNAEFTRAMACRLMYNALSVELLDMYGNVMEGSTILNTYLHTDKINGVLEATFSLRDGREIKPDHIRISGKDYYAPEIAADDYIGCKVVCYVNESDSENILYHIELAGNPDVVVVSASNIEENTTITTFAYINENNKKKNIRLSSELKLFFNGITIPAEDITDEHLKPTSGNVKLIDADSNGVFDIAVVTQCKNYVIRFLDDDLIYDKFGSKLDLYDKHCVFYKDGEAYLQDQLVNGDVLSVAESNDGEMCTVYVSKQYVKGSVTAISNDSGVPVFCVTDEEGVVHELKFSDSYRLAIDSGHSEAITPRIDIKNIYGFYLDVFGDIADITEIEIDDNYIYGFMYRKGLLNEHLKRRASFEILTLNNRFEIFNTQKEKNILYGRYTGGTYKVSRESAEDILADIEEKQLIKYALNDDGDITELYIANSVADNEYFTKVSGGNKAVTYYNKVIDQSWVIDINTAIFATNVSAKYKDAMYAGNYINTLKDGTSNTMTFYDTEGMYVNAVVLSSTTLKRYETVNDGYEFPVNYVNSPVLYINSIRNELKEDGEFYTVLHGYQDGKEMSIALNEELEYYSEPLENLKPGIAIQYVANDELIRRALTSDMIPVLLTYKTVFDFTVDYNGGANWEYSDLRDRRARISTFWGDVVAGDENYCSVNANGDTFSASLHEQTMILKYSKSENKFDLVQNEGVFWGQKVFVRQRYLNTRELVICEREN